MVTAATVIGAACVTVTYACRTMRLPNSLSPQRVQMPQELAIGVELTGYAETAHDVVGANRMDEHALGIALAELAIVDQLRHECDGPHFSHQRGVEADFINAIHDFACRCRHFRPFHRIDVHDENIGRFAGINQREQRRISHVAAVPVMLAVDLDGLIEERQAGRRKHAIRSDLLVREDLDLSGPHVRRRQEQLDCRTLPQPLEVDNFSAELA